MQKRVVITGLGIVSPAGIGKQAFWDGLMEGKSGIEPISLFDVSGFRSRHAGEVRDLSAVSLPGRKEQWTVSRSITMAASAATLALEDAGIQVTDQNRHDIGVVYGATLACLNVMARFDQQSMREGPRLCDPGMFPDTGVGAPACRVSILLGARAFNATLSNGATSSLDALRYGVHFIRMGRAHTVLAGGVEELCLETYLGYYSRKALSGSRNGGGGEGSRPFDRTRNGIVPGEGSAVLVLEDYDHARQRGAAILAEVRGYGAAFDPHAGSDYDKEGCGAMAAMRSALREAEMTPGGIDLIAASANSSSAGDRMEARAIAHVFGDRAACPPVTALKSMLGESYSAAGAFQAAAAALAIQRGGVPPTINCTTPDPDCPVGAIVTSPQERDVDAVLVNAFGWTGTNAAMVLAKAPIQ